MQVLRFVHVLAMIAWLGTAAGEFVLELVLWRTKSATKQRAYIELHRIVDVCLEGPALILTLITGILLLWKGGYFIETTRWPSWLSEKLICVAAAMGANLICIAFVLLRASNTDAFLGNTPPLNETPVRRWHLAVTSTFLAIPFGLMALWLVVNKPPG